MSRRPPRGDLHITPILHKGGIRVDLDILREFITLAEKCNYQEAASALVMSQSALSKHISKLENELGIQLFDRAKRGITLSPCGELFLGYAAQMCALEDESTQALQELHARNSSKLSIGFMRLHGSYGLMETLHDFNTLHPDIEITMIEKTGAQLKTLLAAKKCDFIFGAENSDNRAFRTTPYKTDRLAVVVPADHPMAGKSAVTLEELAGEKFVGARMNYEMRLFNALCSEHDFHPNYIASISNAATVLRLVALGYGVSVMSRQVALSCGNPNVAIVALKPEVSFNVCMLSAWENKFTPAAKLFFDFITENYGGVK